MVSLKDDRTSCCCCTGPTCTQISSRNINWWTPRMAPRRVFGPDTGCRAPTLPLAVGLAAGGGEGAREWGWDGGPQFRGTAICVLVPTTCVPQTDGASARVLLCSRPRPRTPKMGAN